MFIKDAFDDGVVFFLCVCKNNVIDVNLYPTGLKFFCQDGLKQPLKVGRCHVLSYVMWNLFTVGSLQFYSDTTVASLKANQNRPKIQYYGNK